MPLRYDEYEWSIIQSAYDEGCSYRQLTERFGCANATIQKARSKGLFVSRDKNALKVRSGRKYVLRRLDGKCRVCDNKLVSKGAAHCSTACYAYEKRERYIIRWKDGLESGTTQSGGIHSFLREYLLSEANDTCSVTTCGFRGYNPTTGLPVVQVDHIDGDSGNNSFSNLRVLCPNCHSMTPNFGRLNLGRGRQSRRISRARQADKVRKASLLVVMQPARSRKKD